MTACRLFSANRVVRGVLAPASAVAIVVASAGGQSTATGAPPTAVPASATCYVEAPGSPYPVGGGPTSIDLADFNLDGPLDFATANMGADTVTIGLVEAMGLVTEFDIPVGRDPVSIALDDLDSDGIVDFATANSFDNTVTIAFGNMTPNPTVRTEVLSTGPFLPGEPKDVALGDIDGDGTGDYAVAERAMGIHLGMGIPGTQSFMQSVVVGVNHNAEAVALGDLDGDGDLDFVTAGEILGGLSIVIGHRTGPQTYVLTQEFPFLPIGFDPLDVAIGDVNGDGVQDFVVAVPQADKVVVGVQFPDLSGFDYVEVSVPTPLTIDLADVNGDGRHDFVTASPSQDAVVIGRAENGMGPISFSLETVPVGRTPRAVALGDINQDGAVDFATANTDDSVSYWYGCAAPPVAQSNGRTPGSLLVYPVHRSGQPYGNSSWYTIVCVTNGNLDRSLGAGGRKGGDTSVLFEYVNVTPNPSNPFVPLGCSVVDRTEFLTPADTFSVLTSCHNAAGNQEGYLVVTATDPDKFKTPWVFNHLMGSECVLTELGGFYVTNAIPFAALGADRSETDADGDGQRDFDDLEYQGVPDELYIDNFVAALGSSLSLINLTGGVNYTATAQLDVWNDNEFPLSATVSFKCWFDEALKDVSLVFSKDFLTSNTPHDPSQLDLNCDGIGDTETGWARITGIVASSSANSVPDPALLGSLTAVRRYLAGGHLLWESKSKQLNGSFLGFGL